MLDKTAEHSVDETKHDKLKGDSVRILLLLLFYFEIALLRK